MLIVETLPQGVRVEIEEWAIVWPCVIKSADGHGCTLAIEAGLGPVHRACEVTILHAPRRRAQALRVAARLRREGGYTNTRLERFRPDPVLTHELGGEGG